VNRTPSKLAIAIGAGLLVMATAIVVNFSNLPLERGLFLKVTAGDAIAGLVTVLVTLAIQLKGDGVYYRFAMERASIVAELNHHVRNAVFPLCLAVQRAGDAEGNRLAADAVERINVALRDAMTDAFAKNVDYGASPVLLRKKEKAA
jgi:hypothetical protein